MTVAAAVLMIVTAMKINSGKREIYKLCLSGYRTKFNRNTMTVKWPEINMGQILGNERFILLTYYHKSDSVEMSEEFDNDGLRHGTLQMFDKSGELSYSEKWKHRRLINVYRR